MLKHVQRYAMGPGGLSLVAGFGAGLVVGQLKKVSVMVREFIAGLSNTEFEQIPAVTPATVKAANAAKVG